MSTEGSGTHVPLASTGTLRKAVLPPAPLVLAHPPPSQVILEPSVRWATLGDRGTSLRDPLEEQVSPTYGRGSRGGGCSEDWLCRCEQRGVWGPSQTWVGMESPLMGAQGGLGQGLACRQWGSPHWSMA